MTEQQFRVLCPCGQSMRVTEAQIGQVGACIQCGRTLEITRALLRPVLDPSDPEALKKLLAEMSDDGVPLDWKEGDVILDLYRVRGLIGEGGMGKVYRVYHRGWDVDLAVKTPRPEILLRPKGVAKFEAECATWISLGLHPHTVSCYYVRRLGGIPRVFAEYVEGGSLYQWIRNGRLYKGGHEQALARILDICIQFCWGLQHAHERGFVHQDVKPGNVLVAPNGLAKVADFGLARAFATEDGTEDNLNRGGMTVMYRAPEQAKHAAVSPKTDMWGWGLSVLEMFVGRVAWKTGESAPRLLEKYQSYIPPAGSPIPRMPMALMELLAGCFAEDPKDRPASMGTVAQVLSSIYLHVTGSPYTRKAPRPAEALADSLNNRAVSLVDLGKRVDASKLWREALKIDPHHPESAYNLGLLQWRSGGLTDDALVDRLTEIHGLQPSDSLVPYLIAQIHLERGDYAAAMECLQSLNPRALQRSDVATAFTQAQRRLDASRKAVHVLEGHNDAVTAACLSNDRSIGLSGSDDNTVGVWDLATGARVGTLAGHTNTVRAICFDGEGRFAISGGADRTLRYWIVATGQCLDVLHGHTGTVRALSLGGHGSLVLSASEDKTLRLWDLDSGRTIHVFEGHTAWVSGAALSVDGRRAVSGGYDRDVRLWNADTGDCMRILQGHTAPVTAVALSQDARWILSASEDGTLRLWDAETTECVRTFRGHDGGVNTLSLSANRAYAASGGKDGTVRLWETDTGRCLYTFTGHSGPVLGVALSHTGEMAASGGRDRTFRVWQTNCGEETVAAPMLICRAVGAEAATSAGALFKEALDHARHALAKSDLVACAHYVRTARSLPGRKRAPESMVEWRRLYARLPKKNLAECWEGGLFRSADLPLNGMAMAGNGRYLLASSGQNAVEMWNLQSNEWMSGFGRDGGLVNRFAIDDFGRTAVTGGWDIRVYDAREGSCTRVIGGQTEPLRALALSGDARLVLSGGTGWVKLWVTATGQQLWAAEGHGGEITALTFNSDGRYALSGGDDEILLLWDIAQGQVLRAVSGKSGPITSAVFSPDDKRAAVASAGRWGNSGCVHIWDLGNGKCVQTLNAHAGVTSCVAWTADSQYLLTGGDDRVVKMWKVATGELVYTFEGHTAAIAGAAISTDGGHAVTADRTGDIRIWLLDWELIDKSAAEWHDGAWPYLMSFLSRQTPPARELPEKGEIGPKDITTALTRRGRATWTDGDFERFMFALGGAGYGWLRREGVLAHLQSKAASWSGPPRLYSGFLSTASDQVAGKFRSLFNR